MEKKYKFIKKYLGSLEENIILILFVLVFGFIYYRDEENKFLISKELVENNFEYFERVLSVIE